MISANRLGAIPPSGWLWFALPWLAAVGLYWPILVGMAAEWAEFPSLSHGFAIPAIAAYLIWSRRDRIAAVPVQPSPWGLPVLVVGLGALLVGAHADEAFIARVSLLATCLGLALLLGGGVLTRQVWPGIAFLAFMVPLPWSTLKLITYRSRILDADVSAWALRVLGVPIHQDGVLLHLPNITLEVADACSSIPAIAALLSLGVAYACLYRRSLPITLILIGVTLPFAIVANIIRIVTTALGAYYIGPWTLQSAYHMFNGTVNFVLTFLLLLALDTALSRWRRPAPA